MIGGPYVLAFVLALVLGAGFEGYHLRDREATAEISSIKSGANARVAEAKEKGATVGTRVVIEYRDRIVKVRENSPEVVHEIQVVKDSGCTLPPEWRKLHDAAAGAGSDSQAPAGTNDSAESIDCATAIETVRENYERARENALQLEALQKWLVGISSP